MSHQFGWDIVGWHEQPELQGVDNRTAFRAINIAKFRSKVYRKGSVLLRQTALFALLFAAIVLPNWGQVHPQLVLIPAYIILAKFINIKAYRKHAFPLLEEAVEDASKFPLKQR